MRKVATGPISNVATATPQGIPHSVTSFGAAPGTGQVKLTWTAPLNTGGLPITGYDIVYKPIGSSSNIVTSVSAYPTSFTAQNLTNGTEYSFTISARNALGQGVQTTIQTTPALVPGVPKNIASSPGSNQITLSWEAPDSDGGLPITGYTILYGTTNGSFSPLANVSASTTSYTAMGLTSSVAYYFVVHANNIVGAGSNSDVTWTAPLEPPGACRPC